MSALTSTTRGHYKHNDKRHKVNALYNYIVDYMLDNGYSPTRAEMAEYLQVTDNVLYHYLKELRGRKLLEVVDKRDRTAMVIKGMVFNDPR